MPLSELRTGDHGEVVEVQVAQPLLRRRLLDLGLTPGARVRPELSNAWRAARAYRVRGTLVALRQEHARDVLVRTGAD